MTKKEGREFLVVKSFPVRKDRLTRTKPTALTEILAELKKESRSKKARELAKLIRSYKRSARKDRTVWEL